MKQFLIFNRNQTKATRKHAKFYAYESSHKSNDARYVNILHMKLYGGRAREKRRLGATVKRTAYRIVAFGEDVVNFTDYYNNVSEALQIVRLFHIKLKILRSIKAKYQNIC